MMTKFKAFLTAALFSMSFLAQASIIVVDKGLTNTNHFENFEGGKVGNNVSDQFASNGITFETWGPSGITLTSNAVCNNMSSGVAGKYLIMGANYPCSTANSKVNMVSVMFADNVSELSWSGFSRAVGKGFAIQALYDGAIVSELDFDNKNRFDNKSVMISGNIFNELRFLEYGNYQGFFAIDNMAWNVTSEVPNGEVPIPGTVALMGLGLLGLGFARKKKNPA
jgi:hypothetical protein